MVKHTPTIRRLLPTNCLSVYDHFMGLTLKGLKLKYWLQKNQWYSNLRFHNYIVLYLFFPRFQSLYDFLIIFSKWLDTGGYLISILKGVFLQVCEGLFSLPCLGLSSWFQLEFGNYRHFEWPYNPGRTPKQGLWNISLMLSS